MAEVGTKEWWSNLLTLLVFGYGIFIVFLPPGFDRLYRGQVLWGLLKLFTFGGFLIWHFVDMAVYTYRFGTTGQWVQSDLELGVPSAASPPASAP